VRKGSRVSDPIERIIADALDARGLEYICDGEGDTNGLDFFLCDFGVHIEVKQFHTDRVAEQMRRVHNVIVIQGETAALAFAGLIKSA
jgi:hypothetical protein